MWSRRIHVLVDTLSYNIIRKMESYENKNRNNYINIDNDVGVKTINNFAPISIAP